MKSQGESKGDSLRKRAEKILSQKPQDIQKVSVEDMKRLIHELDVHQIELDMQNEELRRQQVESDEAKDRYRNLYDFAPIGYFTFDPDGRIAEVNLTGARLLGLPRSRLIGRSFSLFVARDFLALFRMHLQEVFASNVRQTCELKIRQKPETSTSSIYVSLDSIAAGKDEEIKCRSAIIDTNERNRMEVALREYERVIENSRDIIAAVDRNYKYVLANALFLKYEGLDRSQVIGRSVRDIVGEDVFETVVKKNLDACFRGETVQYEIKRVYPELGERDLLVGYFPVENPNGINRIVSIIQDITERKRAENALQESEARYRTFFENSIDAVLITSPDGSIQEANAEACRIFGMTREELAGAGRNGVTDPSDPNLAVAIEERAQTGRFKGELNLRRSDGTIFPCEVSSSIFTDEKGFMKTSMIIRDITERKQMMKEREDLVLELQKTLAEVRTLRGILPICASCKRIRDDKGYWNQLEAYIRDHSEAEFSHSLCPECIEKLYPGYGDKLKMG